MWALDNYTPFGAERTWCVDKHGAKNWAVAVRGAFDILPDGSTWPAEKQEPALLIPRHIGEPDKSSLLYDADLHGPKRGTDVIVNAHAWAPGGRPATQVSVSIKVHSINKSLLVTGERRWEKGATGPSLGTTAAFTKMPIVYERTFGGWDATSPDPKEQKIEPANPIGTGVAFRREFLLGKLAPSIQSPGHGISTWGRLPPPAGFGAIPTHWSPRREFAGTYDEKWQRDRFPLWPADFDERYFSCAPIDQQIKGFLMGGEKVELVNLTKSGNFTFAIPKVYLTFTTWFGLQTVEHRSDLHTVIVEPDHPRVILVWFTSLACHKRMDYLDKTVIREKPYQ